LNAFENGTLWVPWVPWHPIQKLRNAERENGTLWVPWVPWHPNSVYECINALMHSNPKRGPIWSKSLKKKQLPLLSKNRGPLHGTRA
jgi:hypothetical protein